MQSRTIPPLVVAAVGLLSSLNLGAGCTHWHARFNGPVQVDETFAEHEGAMLYLVFWQLDPDDPTVVLTREHTGVEPIHPLLTACENGQQQRFDQGKLTYEFVFCSHNVGVFYKARVAAFIDANGNGKLDAGEPFGLYADNPLDREKEDKLRQSGLRITIDRTYVPSNSGS